MSLEHQKEENKEEERCKPIFEILRCSFIQYGLGGLVLEMLVDSALEVLL